MRIDTLISGPIHTNTYVASGARENECFIVDPADAFKALLFLKEQKLKLTHILLTHGHFDHILGVYQLQRETGAKVLISFEDAASLQNDKINLAAFANNAVTPSQADMELHDGDAFEAAGFSVKAIATPGHTKGGMCFQIESERVLFTGDTLFHLDIGRSDLPGGDGDALIRSIKTKLFTLEGDYDVYPGHEEKSTLDEERVRNPHTKPSKPW